MANGEQLNQALIRQQRNIRGLAQATQQRQAQAQLEQQQIQQRELVTQQQEAQELQQQRFQRESKVVELINRQARGESVGLALSGLNRAQLTEFLRLQQNLAEQRGASQTIQTDLATSQIVSNIEGQFGSTLTPSEIADVRTQVETRREFVFLDRAGVPQPQVQGPVQEQFSEQQFRQTGQLVAQVQGPTPIGFSRQQFRETGQLVEVPRVDRGEFGGLAIGVAPTIGQRFAESTAGGQQPVRGTLSFVGESIQGALSRTELGGRGQSLAGTGFVSTTAQVAPFFTPIGPALALGFALEQFTPVGIEQAQQFGTQLQQRTGLPSGVGTGAVLGGAGAIGFLGGLGVAGQVGKLRPPSFDVRIVGSQAQVGEQGAFGRFLFQAERQGLFPRQFLGGAESELRFVGKAGNNQLFASGTRGATREFFQVLPSGKLKFQKPVGFAGAEFGEISARQLEVLLSRSSQAEIRQILDGSFIRSVGAGTPIKKASSQFFISQTGVAQIGDQAIIGGVSRFITPGGKILRGGGRQVGIIRRVQAGDLQPTFEITGGQQLTQVQRLALQQQLNQQVIRSAEASLVAQQIATNIQRVNLARSSGGVFASTTQFFSQPTTIGPSGTQVVTEAVQFPTIVGGTGAPSLFVGQGLFETTQAPSLFVGQGLFETTQAPLITSPTIISSSLLGPTTKDKSLMRSISKLSSGLSQKEKQELKQKSGLLLRQSQQQRLNTIGRQGFAQPQAVRQRTRLANIQLSLLQQRQKQKQFLKQIQSVVQRARTRLRGFPVAIPLLDDVGSRIPKSLAKLRGKITPEVKIKDIWTRIGKPTTLQKAKRKMLRVLDNTLSASGRLKSNGNILNLKSLPSGFRKSKVNPLIVVEKRNKRLDSRSEVRAIKKARRKKK